MEVETEFMADKIFTISEAAKSLKVTRQAIYIAIKMKRLNAYKDDCFWRITSQDLRDYLDNRYTRMLSRHLGELIFDKKKGIYSINDAAQFLKTNVNRVYYMVRLGILPSSRIGGNIIIKREDLNEYLADNRKKSGKKIPL